VTPLVAFDFVRLGIGAALLYFGAGWLVSGSAGLARALGVRPLVIGLTVVAWGTSAPELVVSAAAALHGSSDIALGNVIGSNLANLGLILGITTLIAPPAVDGGLARREIPVLVGATLLLPLLILDGRIGRAESMALLVSAVLFTAWTIRQTGAGKSSPRHGSATDTPEEGSGSDTGSVEPGPISPRVRMVAMAVVGLILLVAGGKAFVDGSVGLARALGMSERVVGLTIVAVGTSLPELAASVVAALRGHSSLAIGNVIGSNIFNILLILGGAGSLRPIDGNLGAMRLEITALVGLTIFSAFLLRRERTISRIEGVSLLLLYLPVVVALVR
jgi:cation:H+ antiporter